MREAKSNFCRRRALGGPLRPKCHAQCTAIHHNSSHLQSTNHSDQNATPTAHCNSSQFITFSDCQPLRPKCHAHCTAIHHNSSHSSQFNTFQPQPLPSSSPASFQNQTHSQNGTP